MWKAVWIYLIVINLIAFFLMYSDKKKAKKGLWRIPEKTLFLFSALGGSLGCICGMYLFHHKTRHKKFTVGIPIFLFLQIAGVILCVKRIIP